MKHFAPWPVVMTTLAIQACQPSANVVPVTPQAVPASAGAAPITGPQEADAVDSLTGQASLANATIALKDALTGNMLAAGGTDGSGRFALALVTRPSTGLVQAVVTGQGVTHQALVTFDADVQIRSRRLLQAAPITVTAGTTFVAEAIGPKLAEIFLAGGGSNDAGRQVLRDSQILAADIDRTTGTTASLSDARRQVFGRSDVRSALSGLVMAANSAIVAAFRTQLGAVFTLRPTVVPDAGLDIEAPAITIEATSGQVRVTTSAGVETFTVSTERVRAGTAATDTAIALIQTPTTAVTTGGQSGTQPVASATTSRGSSGGSSGGRTVSHSMWISDIVLADSNTSILGANAPGSLSYAPQGTPIRLTLRGQLNANHPPSLDASDYAYPGFPFAGLIQQTFVDNLPHRRILLDGSILLPLVPNAPLTDSEATVSLDPRALVDLATGLQHRVTVIDREDSASVDIRVDTAGSPATLQPRIARVQLVDRVKFRAIHGANGNGHAYGHDKDGPSGNEQADGSFPRQSNFSVMQEAVASEEADDDVPRFARVEGVNLPVGIYAHWAQINGVRGYAHATWVTDEADPKTILFLHLPEGFADKGAGKNTLAYANPFGLTYFTF